MLISIEMQKRSRFVVKERERNKLVSSFGSNDDLFLNAHSIMLDI